MSAAIQTPTTAPGNGARRCLIVDANRIVRAVTRRILEELGLTCAEAADGPGALAALPQLAPGLVLVDWPLPAMGGDDFTRAVRSGAAPGLAIVFCSAECSAGSIRRALEAGADEYIMKPFDSGIVRAKLRHVGLI